MKQFQLSNFIFNENTKTYTIWLGNRTGIEFTSKRFMFRFLADTNRFLTDTMIELNIIYKHVFCEYRDSWFVMLNFKNGKRVNLSDIERRLEKLMVDISDQFGRAGNSFRGSASSGWSFRHLENVTLFLLDAIELLIQVNKRRNNTINYRSLEIMKLAAEKIGERILKYPQFTPEGSVSINKN